MPRTQVIYANEALYVGPSPATGLHVQHNLLMGNTGAGATSPLASGRNYITGLYRVQSIDFDFGINRTPINQFGEHAAIDRVILNAPTVNLGFSYLLANMANEKTLGFHVASSGNGVYAESSAIKNIINKTQDEKNYFIKTSAAGVDAVGDTAVASADVGVTSFGNGFITSYSANMAVGQLPRVDVRIEALNMAFTNSISGVIPAIHPISGIRFTELQPEGHKHVVFSLPYATSSISGNDGDISTLRPGDITVSIFERQAGDEGVLSNATSVYSGIGADLVQSNLGIVDASLQSVQVGFNMSRDVIERLGSRYGISREINFPVPVTVSLDAIVGDLTTGYLDELIDCDKSYDLHINMKNPSECDVSEKRTVAHYKVKNAKLNGQSYRSSIGGRKTVSLSFESQVGGPNQTTVGLFMSGYAAR
jgi:hypothetical protein